MKYICPNYIYLQSCGLGDTAKPTEQKQPSDLKSAMEGMTTGLAVITYSIADALSFKAGLDAKRRAHREQLADMQAIWDEQRRERLETAERALEKAATGGRPSGLGSPLVMLGLVGGGLVALYMLL